MGFIAVLVAGVAAFAVGAIWYMTLGARWMAAAGVTAEEAEGAGPVPYLVSFAMALLVAGALRAAFAAAGITGPAEGLGAGLLAGLCVAAPWIVNNVMFSNRSRQLIWMDGGYPVIGMAIMGLVLAWLAPDVAAG